MWSTRKGLILQNLAILVVIVLIRLEPRPKSTAHNVDPAENPLFLDTLRNALDAVYYLQDMERGRAHVAPVVEEPRAVVMRRPCQNDVERVFKEEGWIRNGPWHLFSAYADLRNNSLYPGRASVQIIASAYGTPVSASHKWYCHFASPNSSLKFTVEARLRLIWQRGWDPRGDFYNPYLITCGLPSDYYRDVVLSNDYYVAIDQRRCIRSSSIDHVKITRPPGNALRSPSHTPKVAVCVKGMDFTDDRTQPFVEWLELQYLLGADAVAVYVYYVPAKLRDAMRHYEKKGRLRVVDLMLPNEHPNDNFARHGFIWRNRQQKRRHELIPYNDCFYRYSHSHDYVLLLDTDEVVVPLKNSTWPGMLATLARTFKLEPSSLSIRNVFKFPDKDAMRSPSELHLLVGMRSSVLQDKEYSGKSFINTRTVATVFNHFALHRLHQRVSRTAYIDPEVAIKLHYKSACPSDLGSQCEEVSSRLVRDHSLDRYGKELTERVREAMAQI